MLPTGLGRGATFSPLFPSSGWHVFVFSPVRPPRTPGEARPCSALLPRPGAPRWSGWGPVSISNRAICAVVSITDLDLIGFIYARTERATTAAWKRQLREPSQGAKNQEAVVEKSRARWIIIYLKSKVEKIKMFFRLKNAKSTLTLQFLFKLFCALRKLIYGICVEHKYFQSFIK